MQPSQLSETTSAAAADGGLGRPRRPTPGRWPLLALACLLLSVVLVAGGLGATLQATGGPEPPVAAGRLEGHRVTAATPPTSISIAAGELATKGRYSPAPGAATAILWLSGIDGGLDGPFAGFYSQLAGQLQRRGLASFQLLADNPGDFELTLSEAEQVLDFLRAEGYSDLRVVGFSFGGGVAVALAVQRAEVGEVVVLSGQGYGTENVADLAPRRLYWLHAEGDDNIPLETARDVLARAEVPAVLVVVGSSDHYLQDVARQVTRLVRDWLLAGAW